MRIELTPRLMTITGFIEENDRVADIGTDHGRLPAWLAQNHPEGYIIATDIREKPLARALATARRHGVEGRIKFVLCDGLEGISEGAANTVVIAGMGGDSIVDIIQKSQWIRSGVKLILQPARSAEDLRHWLYENGFIITDEALTRDRGRIYETLSARGGAPEKPHPSRYFAGQRLLEKNDPLFGEYADKLIVRMKKASRGARASSKETDPERAEYFDTVLEGLIEMKGEWEKWQRSPM